MTPVGGSSGFRLDLPSPPFNSLGIGGAAEPGGSQQLQMQANRWIHIFIRKSAEWVLKCVEHPGFLIGPG